MISYQNLFLFSRLGGVEYTTGSLQKCKTPTNECPRYDTKQSDGEAPVAFGNADYPFMTIAPRSTLVRSGST